MNKIKLLTALLCVGLFVACGDGNKPIFGVEHVKGQIGDMPFLQAQTDMIIYSIVAEDGNCVISIPFDIHNMSSFSWKVSKDGKELLHYGFPKVDFTKRGMEITEVLLEKKKFEKKLKKDEKFHFRIECYPAKTLVLETNLGKFEYKNLKRPDDKK